MFGLWVTLKMMNQRILQGLENEAETVSVIRFYCKNNCYSSGYIIKLLKELNWKQMTPRRKIKVNIG